MVDVKVTSTDKMNDAFKEKDEKCREWATRETREKKVMMAVMVPLIVSHDGAIHKDAITRWKNFASDIQVDWVRIARVCCATTLSLWANSSIRGAGSQRRGEKSTQKSVQMSRNVLRKEFLPPKREGRP